MAGLMPATGVDIDESPDETEGRHGHVFALSAKPAPAEALVVRSTRWEDGVKVLVLDEILCKPSGAAGCRISLVELAPNYWRLSEAAVAQHLQGVRLVRCERTPTGVIIELHPAGEGPAARRRYLIQWEARVEKWTELDRRYPDLPAHPAGVEWVQWRIIFPGLPADGAG